MKHAGIHWPANAGGEHPNVETILGMPGIARGCTLICADSARYWYRQARGASPFVVWRSIPRQGKLPAELGWDPRKVAAECFNLWDEQPHGGVEWLQALNELQFRKESGETWKGYADMAAKLDSLRPALRDEARRRGQDVRLLFPPWVPGDDLDRLAEWRDAAMRYDAVCVHAYGSAEEMRARYAAYRAAFPGVGLFVGEWNANHTGASEAAALEMWARVADTDPGLMGVTYYIWETHNGGEGDLSIWGDPGRLALFNAPPTVEPTPPEEPPMPNEPDPWEHWSASQIAEAAQVPQANVEATWPHVVAQLDLCGINRPAVQIGVIGTMAHETGSSFLPVREAYYLGEPEPAETYRRTLAYYPYYGRGAVQLTHEGNYRRYSDKLAQLWGAGSPDLAARPDDALDQDVSAAVIAMWFRDERALPTSTWPDGYSLQNACDLADDEWIRRLVYGGRDPVGEARIARVRAVLTTGSEPRPLAYDPSTPPERQIQSWACSIRAVTWALRSLGVAVDAGQMQDEMVPGTVTPALGLLDGRGYGLAAILGRHLPAGTRVEVVENITAAQVTERAGRGPMCMGSYSLYHWLNVADRRGDGVLVAPNPAPAWQGLGDDLTPEEFARWAPWNAVFVEVLPPSGEIPDELAHLRTLVGVAYHEDGVVVPGLVHATQQTSLEQMRQEVNAVVAFLRNNNPDQAVP